MWTLIALILTMFSVYAVSGFLVFYFGSNPTEQELGRREAITCALVLGLTATVTSFLGLTGLLLTFFLVVSVLVKLYDCGLANSFLMTAGALLLPGLFFLGLHAIMGG